MVFDALPQGKLCICTKKIILRQKPTSYTDFVMRNEETEQAADLFLTLWQENIRLWAQERDLLPHSELADLLRADIPGHKRQGDASERS